MGFFWVDSSHGNIPKDAVHGGNDVGGAALFIGRAQHEGDVLPAKIAPAHGCAFVSWGGMEIRKLNYSVLCSRKPLKWQSASNGQVPSKAYSVGRTRSGEKLYVGRVFHEGTLTLGKVHPSHGCCYISFADKEHSFRQYEILLE